MASQTSEPSTTRVSDEIKGSVGAFAGKNGVSESEVRELIVRWGNDHSVLTAEASRLVSSRT